MKRLFILLLSVSFVWACGGSSGNVTDDTAGGGSTVTFSSDSSDSASDVDPGSSFKFTFDDVISTDSVNSETFFIVPISSSSSTTDTATASLRLKASLDVEACDKESALEASITCASNGMSCTLNPDEDLEEGSSFSLCMIGGSSSSASISSSVSSKALETVDTSYIQYEDPTKSFESVMFSLATSGEASGGDSDESTACETSVECDEDDYCMFGTCMAKSEVGILTDSVCESDDCPEGYICMQGGYDVRDCSIKHCVEMATFYSEDNGAPQTEAACNVDYYWYSDFGICLTIDLEICVSEAMGGDCEGDDCYDGDDRSCDSKMLVDSCEDVAEEGECEGSYMKILDGPDGAYTPCYYNPGEEEIEEGCHGSAGPDEDQSWCTFSSEGMNACDEKNLVDSCGEIVEQGTCESSYYANESDILYTCYYNTEEGICHEAAGACTFATE